MAGGGDNVWGTADEFQFAYQAFTGDVDISARVSSFDAANEWSKAGVMIRDGLAANARNAYALVSPGIGAALQYRAATGGATARTDTSAAPTWVRLVRQGSRFTAYRSADGRSWTTISATTISMPATVYVGFAVTSRGGSQLATATFSSLQIGPALPTPWRSHDVGNPDRAGTAASTGTGAFTIAGAGAAIWGNADEFQYVYQAVQGDTEIIARVASLKVTHEGAKAGVMIRESMSAGARHASMFATGGNGWSFQYREVTNGLSFTSPGPGGNAPGWVRLVRSGNLFTAYHSTDGSTWSQVGSESIAMTSSVYVGLAVSSRVATTTTSASFTGVKVSAPTAGGNKPPVVSISSPSSGSYNAPASMIVTATASDPDGKVTKVDIYQGSKLLKSDTTAPYSVAWTGVAAGTYELTAVARDDDGATKTSAAVTVTVKSGTNQPPSVSISAPAAGSSFTAPANIPIQAGVSDSDGRVTRVEFYRGSTLIGSDTTSPYAVTWTGAPVGTYTLTAKAFDEDGASRTSTGVSVTVRSASNQLPAVSITSPKTGATLTAPASVTITATATDSDGTIAGVDFYVGSQLFATDTTSPYSASWTNVAAGTYTLTARARDNSGGTRTSTAVTVTVSGGSTSRPTSVVFVPSSNNATSVTSYTVAIYRSSDPVTGTAVATRNLGKPAAVSGEISADISTLVNPLAAGSYYAVVRAVGPGGTTASTKSANFTK